MYIVLLQRLEILLRTICLLRELLCVTRKNYLKITFILLLIFSKKIRKKNVGEKLKTI